MIKPKALKQGDTIGIVAPSSPADRGRLHRATSILENLGYKVRHSSSCFEKYGYLAAQDEKRAEDINSMFKDPTIDAIFCMRGGYGSMRILDLIDYDAIYKNPKIFMGYSDITALHIAITQKCQLVTFHGPMLTSDFALEQFKDYTEMAMIKALTSTNPLGSIKAAPGMPKEEMIFPGSAEGIAIGGNLSLITATLGTPYEIDTWGKLLIIEELEEEPYRIDRMLTQLKLAEKLDDAAGIVLGQFTSCESKDPENSLTLDQVFKDILVPLRKPIIKNVCFGHDIHKATIPMGVKARIDGNSNSFIVKESAIKTQLF